MQPSKRALSRVGEAAITARMTPPEVSADTVRAMNIAIDAIRATLGLSPPNDPSKENHDD